MKENKYIRVAGVSVLILCAPSYDVYRYRDFRNDLQQLGSYTTDLISLVNITKSHRLQNI